MLVKDIKLLDVDLVQRVLGAELVDLVVNFVIDPCLVVIDGVVLDCIPGQIFVKSVDDFNPLKVDDDTTLGSARHITDRVSLH